VRVSPSDENQTPVSGSEGPVVAVVPARAGSKALPRKNVALLGGHPLVAYSIAAALESTLVDVVLCSTDDDEIAAIATEYGATVIARPEALARDDTPDLPVFEHALTWLSNNGIGWPRALVHLRPTAPLRPHDLVDHCVQLLDGSPAASSVRTIAPAPHTPYKMWVHSDSEAFLRPLLTVEGLSEACDMPRQMLPEVWWHNGSVDVIRPATIAARSMSGPCIVPAKMSLADSIDIDDEFDLLVARAAMAQRDDIVRPAVAPWIGCVDLVICDVDGTLTPGTMHYGRDGEELKSFHTRDGMAARLLQEADISVALVTGESSEIVVARAKKLQIEHVILGASDKRAAVGSLLASLQHDGSTAAFLGDDINDLAAAEVLRERGGHFVAVADADPRVRAAADIVLTTAGGSGALRELADRIFDNKIRTAATTAWHANDD